MYTRPQTSPMTSRAERGHQRQRDAEEDRGEQIEPQPLPQRAARREPERQAAEIEADHLGHPLDGGKLRQIDVNERRRQRARLPVTSAL